LSKMAMSTPTLIGFVSNIASTCDFIFAIGVICDAATKQISSSLKTLLVFILWKSSYATYLRTLTMGNHGIFKLCYFFITIWLRRQYLHMLVYFKGLLEYHIQIWVVTLHFQASNWLSTC
jgi:hypothetical protein